MRRGSSRRSITLALALIVAMTLMWAASAQSKAGKPIPEDRIADVQLLGVNDFHGNLESPRTLPDEGGEEMLRLINGGQRNDGLQFKDGPDGEPVNTSDPNFPGANFPYIAANTLYKDSGKTVLPPYQIIKRDGVDVGFIGVTTLETPSIVVPDAVAPFNYTDISEHGQRVR